MTAETTPDPSTLTLDLRQDVALLTAAIMDINSVSGNETELADAIEAALLGIPQLSVLRDGDSMIARTELGCPERVILAGHLDTVPLPLADGAKGTVPSTWDSGVPGEGILYGRGATDMKGGVAVQLALAATMFDDGASPKRDVTFVFYDHEEVEAVKSGLGRLVRNHGHLLDGDFAILLEPTHGTVEGGCNGTSRFEVTTVGEAAHSARAWMGSNAIHAAAPILARLAAYQPLTVNVDGLEYRESLNAVKINGGTAGNVIPDRCVVEINYRFAPDKTPDQAEAVVRELLEGFDVVRTDAAAGARPGLQHPAAASFVSAVGARPKPKYGWTDVARFSELGIPAVNFGPGDPLLAHKDNEHVDAEAIRTCLRALQDWMAG
ncbi:succinyl-diaminopimelate desuccinylase [Arthrobacter sp. BB-1]|uniref:succinyl-diaminopimelate desuccinylase n=1 Tax=unclassified Arthrobacter TaxID=235627 RepID=UPI0010ED614E|nr:MULTISPECIES: succinyl-diaminopimelate desuccinylase [unclassified Arthrobacter]TNB71264.1 succinyl-diaminopimelate desuccinylase [Arthrobacter sp. BB-1]VII97045.1 N-succinyl-L,L-diaminopimelate desuccinylase (EC 3.5.1.18) [Arthrobacter sp. DR-2P]